MGKSINVEGLNRASKQYDPILRMLPYNQLKQRLLEMGFRFISSDKELTEVEKQRKGGISKPYVPGSPVEYEEEIMKLREATLKPEWAKTCLKENILNYEEVNVVGNSPEHVDPVSKKHPLELEIIQTQVITVGEDTLDALYHAKRDTDDKSPYGMFNGINYLIDVEIADGEIAAAKGNLYATGSIVAPVNATDTDAYDKLVAFIRFSDPMLRKVGILKMTPIAYFACADALRNKLKTQDLISQTVFMQNLTADTLAPQSMRLSIEDEMGTGDRIILTIPQNFDFSLWTEASGNFVQVRNPYEDPNDVQFWMQWKAGARVRSIHRKSFLTNDGTAVANQLSGDYLS